MPLVVEISIAFSVLIAFIVIGMFLFRIRERFDTRRLAGARPFRGDRLMTIVGPRPFLLVLLGVPLIAAAMLALCPELSVSARYQHRGLVRSHCSRRCRSSSVRPERRHAAASSTNSTSSSSCSTPSSVSPPACSARATSVTKSKSGRLTPTHLRFYHAMFQIDDVRA